MHDLEKLQDGVQSHVRAVLYNVILLAPQVRGR